MRIKSLLKVAIGIVDDNNLQDRFSWMLYVFIFQNPVVSIGTFGNCWVVCGTLNDLTLLSDVSVLLFSVNVI